MKKNFTALTKNSPRARSSRKNTKRRLTLQQFERRELLAAEIAAHSAADVANQAATEVAPQVATQVLDFEIQPSDILIQANHGEGDGTIVQRSVATDNYHLRMATGDVRTQQVTVAAGLYDVYMLAADDGLATDKIGFQFGTLDSVADIRGGSAGGRNWNRQLAYLLGQTTLDGTPQQARWEAIQTDFYRNEQDATVLRRIVAAGTLQGRVVLDENRDGVLATNEPGVPNTVVYVDANGDGELSDGERQVTTNDGGQFMIDDLAIGNYALRSIPADSNLAVTSPNGGVIDAQVTASEPQQTGLNFGMQQHVQEPLLKIAGIVTDGAGNEIDTITVGQQFELLVTVTDLREPAQGVFAAHLDVLYDSAIAAPLEVKFGTEYPNAQTFSLGSGLIDEVGAVSTTTPLGGGDVELFRASFAANAAGLLEFQLDPPEGSQHEALLYGLDFALSPDQLAFVGDQVLVVENSAPVATADSYATSEDEPLIVNAEQGLLANDIDADGDPLTVELQRGTEFGELILQSDGTFEYEPQADFFGTDMFTYRANDTVALSEVVTVTIAVAAVNDPPVPVPDEYSVAAGLTLTVAVQHGLLANDSDVDSDTLTVTVDQRPSGGVVAVDANGAFTFVPNPQFVGETSFRYQVSDGSATAEADVTLNVLPPIAELTARITDLDGNPIQQAAIGQQLLVSIYTEDLRGSGGGGGVFAAALDLEYASILQLSSPIRFGDTYGNLQAANVDTAGEIRDLRAVASTTPHGTGEFLFASIPFVAAQEGQGIIDLGPASANDAEILVFGLDVVVALDRVNFLGTSVEIVAGWQNPSNPLDVNADGKVSALDALVVINRLNEFGGSHELPAPSGDQPPPFYDVNDDGNATALDALIVINSLDRVPLPAEGESFVAESAAPDFPVAAGSRRQRDLVSTRTASGKALEAQDEALRQLQVGLDLDSTIGLLAADVGQSSPRSTAERVAVR